MKKALFILNDLSLTGASLTALHVIKNLPKDIETSALILCSENNELLLRESEYKEVLSSLKIMNLPHTYGKKFKMHLSYYLAKIKREIRKEYEENPFDFVYLNQANISGFIAKYVRKKFKAKVVFNSLGKPAIQTSNFYVKYLFNKSLKLTCKHSDYFVSISEQCFPKKYVITGSKVLLEDYCDLKVKNDEKIFSKKGTINIGQIGYFSNNKNQIYTLKLLVKLIEQNVDVNVKFLGFATNEEYNYELDSYISLHDLKEKVTFYSREYDKNSFFDSIDLLVIPSLSEGYPLVIKESISQKTPVLGSFAIPAESEKLGVKRLALDDFDEWISFIKSELYKVQLSDDILMKEKETYKNIINDIFN